MTDGDNFIKRTCASQAAEDGALLGGGGGVNLAISLGGYKLFLPGDELRFHEA